MQHTPDPDLSLWQRTLLGIPSELYFFLRWLYLMVITPKDFLSSPNESDNADQAVVFVYGLFGNSYQFCDLKKELLQQNPNLSCYFFDYPHGQLVEDDAQDLANFIKKIPSTVKKLTIIGHSRGGVVGYRTLALLPQGPDYSVITIASPMRGADIAFAFAYAMRQNSFWWIPVQFFIRALIWLCRTKHTYEDFSRDYFPPPQDERFVHHINAKYDIITGKLKKQSLSETASSTIIKASHAGILFSQQTIKTINNLVNEPIEKDANAVRVAPPYV